MRLISKTVLLPVFLIMLGLASSTPVNSSVNGSPEGLPFHAVIDGNANPVPIDPCTLENHETGSGHALHLGVIIWSSDETVQFLSCSPPSPPGPAIAVSGKFTILAASGDEIFGKYQTKGTLDTVNGVSVHGEYSFVSGTGRFSNVTGSGVIAANGIGSPPFDFIASLDGTIRYSRK
jgi:hypothetical protein